MQEYDQQMRRDSFRMEELKQQQLFETKQLPKQIRIEYKQHLSEAKKNMGLRRTPEDKEKLKKVRDCIFNSLLHISIYLVLSILKLLHSVL